MKRTRLVTLVNSWYGKINMNFVHHNIFHVPALDPNTDVKHYWPSTTVLDVSSSRHIRAVAGVGRKTCTNVIAQHTTHTAAQSNNSGPSNRALGNTAFS